MARKAECFRLCHSTEMGLRRYGGSIWLLVLGFFLSSLAEAAANDRILADRPPDEIDVTPQPAPLLTTSKPFDSTSRVPSIRPTLRPSAPIQTATPTPFSDQGSVLPPHRPTAAPLVVATGQPVVATEQPVMATETPVVDTYQPSTSRPTLKPSTVAPVSTPTTSITTDQLTSRPTISRSYSSNTTQPVSLPVNFTVQLDRTVPTKTLAEIWEGYILARLQSAYRKDDAVTAKGVDLIVVEQNALSTRLLLLRERHVQSKSPQQKVQSIGNAHFEVSSNHNMEEFETQAYRVLDAIITKTSFQQALLLGNVDATVSAVQNNLAPSPAPSTSGQRPSTAELAVGFTILGLAILSLLFWARVLWRKRQKRLAKQKASLRMRSQSIVAVPPPAPPKPPVTSSMPTVQEEEGDDGDEYSYHGVSEDESEVSDFTKELKKAASLDRLVWDEYQRKKLQWSEHDRRLENTKVQSIFPVKTDSHEEGLEVDYEQQQIEPVQTAKSFPYGDESAPPVMESPSHAEEALELTLQNAVEWTQNGISIKIPALDSMEDDGKFEPYGDRLVQSWDVDPEEPEPAQYSFLYPLKRQEMSDNTQSSPAASGDEPSSTNTGGFRPSPASSWSTGAAVVMANRNEPSLPEVQESFVSQDDSSDDENTTDMLREVARLSNYVKQLEKQKEVRKTEQEIEHRDFYSSVTPNVSSLNVSSLNATSSLGESRSIPYESLSDSMSARKQQSSPTEPKKSLSIGDRLALRYSKPRSQVNEQAQAPRTVEQLRTVPRLSEFEEADDPSIGDIELESTSGSTDEEDDSSQRLGIGRYSVQRPPAPLLSFSPLGKSSAPSPEADPMPPPPRGATGGNTPVLAPVATRSRPPSRRQNAPRVVESPGPLLSRQTQPVSTPSGSVETGTSHAGSSSVPFDEAKDRSIPSAVTKLKEKSSSWRMKPFNSSPRVRTKNKNFNNIVSMFESRPKNAVVPPNEHVSWPRDIDGMQLVTGERTDLLFGLAVAV